MTLPLYSPRGAGLGRAGMVVPAWFSEVTPPAQAEALLLTTLQDSDYCVTPADVVLVADGSPVAAEAGRAVRERLAGECGEPFTLLELPANGGKGAALCAGLRLLLQRGLDWFAVRDADGDHFLDDLPHLFRSGEQLAAENPGLPACVIGRRASVHAPLGWLRGEYELLLNEVIVEAVIHARAREGGVWDTRYLVERAPDLQSGYKLYNRAAAELALSLPEAAAEHPELNLLRTGMEVVPFVRIALAGGVFAEVERKTFFDQPVSSYGNADFPRFYGAKLAWTLLECAVPPPAAALLIDGALARRPLFTDPAGKARALEMRAFVLDRLCGGTWAPDVPAEPQARRFL